MQGWLFVNDFDFWTEPRVKAFVTSVPIVRTLIFDTKTKIK